MPSKTKKEKLLTETRRKQPLSMPSFSLSFDTPQKLKISDLTVVRRDITKTLYFGLMGIAVELSMYWYSLKQVS